MVGKVKARLAIINFRMAFRIGINLGDVIEENDRIYGDGANIAARIENLAETWPKRVASAFPEVPTNTS